MIDKIKQLLPEPKKITLLEGDFLDCKNEATLLIDTSLKSQAYRLTLSIGGVVIQGGSEVGCYYGQQTLKQLIKLYDGKCPQMLIFDEPIFEHRGMLLDITRGKVPKLSYLKEIIELLAHYKYNQVQLYMEHTFDYSFTKEVTGDKGALTSDDIKELDTHCIKHHIELIPCIATFGHMYELLNHEKFNHLCELDVYKEEDYNWMKRQMHHTINCTDPESLEFVKRMIKEIAPLYKSPYLNISGDETYDIGKGKGKAGVETSGSTNSYIKFLNEIMEEVRQVGKTPMFWGDVILNHPDKLKEIHTDSVPMHWWYEADVSESDFKVMADSGRPYYGCPSVVGWNRWMNDFDVAYENISKMTQLGKLHGAVGMLNTDWGDFGHINFFSRSIPYVLYGANCFWNQSSEVDQTLLHKTASELLYGNEDVVDCLYQVSKCQIVDWEDLMKWYYEKAFGDSAYGDVSEKFRCLEEQTLVAQIDQLDLLSIKLRGCLVKDLAKMDIAEHLNDIQAMQWTLLFGLFLHHRYSGKIVDEKIREALIHGIESWYDEFSSLWSLRNRPSERYRIKEVIDGLISYILVF